MTYSYINKTSHPSFSDPTLKLIQQDSRPCLRGIPQSAVIYASSNGYVVGTNNLWFVQGFFDNFKEAQAAAEAALANGGATWELSKLIEVLEDG